MPPKTTESWGASSIPPLPKRYQLFEDIITLANYHSPPFIFLKKILISSSLWVVLAPAQIFLCETAPPSCSFKFSSSCHKSTKLTKHQSHLFTAPISTSTYPFKKKRSTRESPTKTTPTTIPSPQQPNTNLQIETSQALKSWWLAAHHDDSEAPWRVDSDSGIPPGHHVKTHIWNEDSTWAWLVVWVWILYIILYYASNKEKTEGRNSQYF